MGIQWNLIWVCHCLSLKWGYNTKFDGIFMGIYIYILVYIYTYVYIYIQDYTGISSSDNLSMEGHHS